MKILFLQEYIRENHIKMENGIPHNVFFQTKGGQVLKKLIETGLHLDKSAYYMDYAYAMVPKVISRDKYNKAVKYKPPTAPEANVEYEQLYKRILQEKPDIIIPTGNIGCKALIGKASISSLRGVPVKTTITVKEEKNAPMTPQGLSQETVDDMEVVDLQRRIEAVEAEKASFLNLYSIERIRNNKELSTEIAKMDQLHRTLTDKITAIRSGSGEKENSFETWVLPMYSMEYMFINPSIQNLVEADFVTLNKFVEQGDKAFEASPVDYEFVDSIERVREIFTQEIPKAPITAWDLETNTLRAETKGAKPLVISLSWKEGEGVTIPLEHKDFYWEPPLLTEIYGYIEQFVADPDIPKVLHNGKFDQRFLMLTKGFKTFRNNRDTLILYYLLVNQDVESSLRLSDLSYELTDLGGYDKPLEDFKKQYTKDFIARDKEHIAQLKKEHKEKMELEKKQAKAEGRKPVLVKGNFPKASKPVNEIDGSDFNYEWIPLIDMLSPYASGDVDACLRIFNKLDAVGAKPENERIRNLYLDHYPKLITTLARIEANGIKMNIEYNKGLIEAYTQEEERILQEMRKIPEVIRLEEEHAKLYQAGLEEWTKPPKERDQDIAKLRDKYKKKSVFSPNSPDDKRKVLFEYTGIRLPYNKEFLVDSAYEDNIPEDEIEWFHYKSDKTALEYIGEHYPEHKELADLLLTHSLVKTRKQNFTYKLLGMVDSEGRIHGGFSPTGTATSRLSSNSPNMQQLPRKTSTVTRFDYIHPIKRMFVTSFEGGALLQADFSSLESRVLGLAAMDEEMTQAFLDGADLHKETATFVYGVSIDEVTKEQRSMAKAVTFGLAYGETPFSFAPKHDMTVEEAEEIFEKYFRNKPKVKSFIDQTQEITKKNGYIECLQGFRRNLREVYSQDKKKRNEALRQCVNTEIQGSGAFLTNSSLIHIQNFIDKHNLRSKVVLTVHDSIVVDCPKEEIEIMAKAVKYIMENLPIDWLFIDWKGQRLRYPIAIDLEIGLNYNDMVGLDLESIKEFQSVKGYCDYKMALKKVEDYKESKVIDEAKYDEYTEMVKNQKNKYQMVV